MSLNVTSTPIEVTIIPRLLDPWIYAIIVAGIILFGIFAAIYFKYQPKKIYFTILKKPDGTFHLRTAWGWYYYGTYFNKPFDTLGLLTEEIEKTLEGTNRESLKNS